MSDQSIHAMLEQAIAFHHRGHLAEAENLYRLVILEDENNTDAHHNIGLLARQLGHNATALFHLKQAVQIDPLFGQYRLSFAEALFSNGEWEQAILLLKEAPTDPEFSQNFSELRSQIVAASSSCESGFTSPEVAANWAVELFNQGRFEEMERTAVRLTQEFPKYGPGWKIFGAALQAQKKDSISILTVAANLNPDDFQVLNFLGVAYNDKRLLIEATHFYKKAILLKADFQDAHYNLGYAYQQMNQHVHAAESYNNAIAINSRFAEAHNGLGIALTELRQYPEAIKAYKTALEIKPNFPAANSNLGIAFAACGQLESALAHFEKSIEQQPENANAYLNLGNALKDAGDFVSAESCFQSALIYNPEVDFLYGSWLYTRNSLCEWENYTSNLRTLEEGVAEGRRVTPILPFIAISSSRELQRKCAEIWMTAKYTGERGAAISLTPSADGKIHIAYFSADFHSHATAYLMVELFEKHDKERFTLTAFSFGPDKSDEMRKRIVAACDHFIDVRNESDAAVALMAKQMNVHIAIDLKGFTQDTRLGIFVHRAAPIQVSYLGYPGSLGSPVIDYLVADPIVIPESHQADYVEKIAYLPNSYQVNAKRNISSKHISKQEAGLPSSGFVFCCFNNNYKITPHTFSLWMRILLKVEGSVLWLFEDNPVAASNLKKEAAKRNVDPARLIFAKRMPLEEHLARHRLADLSLDTLPYTAHTTASDALWAGLPLVTCIGNTFAGRVGASILSSLGLHELIAYTEEQYEQLVVDLALDRSKLSEIKRKLCANLDSCSLFDSALFARHIEAAYSQMVERKLSNLETNHIYVKP